MALLDVLSVIFDANADKLKKGAGEAEEVIEETKAAAIDTDKAAADLGKTFLDTIGSAKGAIAGILSLGALTASIVAQAAQTDQLGKFSQRLGENVEDVGAWGEAVARSGGSVEQFQGTVESLSDNLTELAKTGGGAASEALARLGISAIDSQGNIKGVFDLLPELAESFEGLSRADSVELGKKLGLDEATILLLQQGRGEVDKLVERQRSLGVATAEDAAIAATFRDAFDDLKQIFGSITRTIGAYLLPAFTAILKGAQNIILFLREHQDFATGFFIAVAAAITYLYLPAATAAAFTTLLLIAPFLILAAKIALVGAAVALLYDEIQTFLAGGDSFIGLIVDGFVGAFDWFIDSIVGAYKALRDFYAYLIGTFVEGLTGAINKVQEFFGLGGDDPKIMEATKKAQVSIEQAAENPLSGQSAQSLQQTTKSINRNTTVSVGAVNVDAKGGNSQEISANIGTALKNEMQATVSNFDDGIAI